MPLEIVCGNIIDMETDAIVNAANSFLLPGTGVCGTIFFTAGFFRLFIECRMKGFCSTGNAVITNAYKLKAKKIIHTVGPHYKNTAKNKDELLYSCYRSCLMLAKKNELKSIAFPLISAGAYGYPKEKAQKIAETAINEFLRDNEFEVYIVLYDKNFIKN